VSSEIEAIARVRELHKPRQVQIGNGQVTDNRTGITTYPSWHTTTCDYCSRTHVGGYEGVSWPCPTLRALDGAS
jgi:hypothetical protein